MANLDKNIIITPNVGANGDPQIVFSAANTTSNAANITLRAYPTSNGTLSFEGSAGQLFSITNNLTGTLFSVNDISGIPSIEVLDTGRINLAQYNGNVVIGANTSANASTSNTTGELVVFGGVGVTGNLYVGGTNAGANGIYTDNLRYAANGLPWVMNAGGGGGGGGGLPTTAFSRVIISGQPDAIANIANSPLTLVAGSGITLATNGVANSITITSTGGGGGASPSGYLANTIIVANATGFLSNSNAFFTASNSAIITTGAIISGGEISVASGQFVSLGGPGSGTRIRRDGSLNGLDLQTSSASRLFIADTDGAVNVRSTTTSTSNTTGALIVGGGLGVSGNVFVSNSLSILADVGTINRPVIIRGGISGSFGAQIGVLNESLDFYTTGGFPIWFATNGARSQIQFGVSPTVSAVNYLQATGSITNRPVILSGQGSDANVAISLTPKGNGSVMITGNTTSTINVANSLYVGGVVGFANANNISVVYQSYNPATNSLDVVFG